MISQKVRLWPSPTTRHRSTMVHTLSPQLAKLPYRRNTQLRSKLLANTSLTYSRKRAPLRLISWRRSS